MNRNYKIKQISVSNNFVYALSEDGDIYKYFNNKWVMLPEINESNLVKGIKNEELNEAGICEKATEKVIIPWRKIMKNRQFWLCIRIREHSRSVAASMIKMQNIFLSREQVM